MMYFLLQSISLKRLELFCCWFGRCQAVTGVDTTVECWQWRSQHLPVRPSYEEIVRMKQHGVLVVIVLFLHIEVQGEPGPEPIHRKSYGMKRVTNAQIILESQSVKNVRQLKETF